MLPISQCAYCFRGNTEDPAVRSKENNEVITRQPQLKAVGGIRNYNEIFSSIPSTPLCHSDSMFKRQLEKELTADIKDKQKKLNDLAYEISKKDALINIKEYSISCLGKTQEQQRKEIQENKEEIKKIKCELNKAKIKSRPLNSAVDKMRIKWPGVIKRIKAINIKSKT